MKINIKKIFNTAIYWKPNLKFLQSRKFWLISAIISFSLIFLCLFIFLYHLKTPLSKNVEEKIFIVKEGQNLNQIAEDLRLEGIINNKLVFILYVLLQGKANSLQAGRYNLSPSMDIPQIAKKIISGEVVHDWIKVTIPEGWINKQIEEKLIELGILIPEKYEFYRVATEDLPFLADRPPGPDLQGYLFPDTYYFDKENTTVEMAVKKMLTNFGEKLSQNLRDEIKGQGKTIHQIVVMASILEKEVKSDEDRAIVSGIFWKRLKNNYPLESCATIAYVLGADKWRYSFEDTRIKSPYNTYINIGLPPTPINNPGLSAIKAAIYSKETDYNFFLTNPEDGTTIFSKTFEEHNANKRKYFK